MKNKLTLVLVFSLVLMLPLSGCWNRREPEELAVIVGAAFDKSENNGEWKIIALIANFLAVGGGEGNGSNNGNNNGTQSIVVREATGRSIYDAGKNLHAISTRKIDFHHVEILFFSEELAREGLAPILDFLDRERQFRLIARPFVVDGDVRKAAEADFPMEEITTSGINRMLRFSIEQLSESADIRLRHVFIRLAQPGWELVLPRIQVLENENGKSKEEPLRLSGLAAFRKDRMIGWLDEKETRGFMLISGLARRISYVIDSPPPLEKDFTVEIFESSARQSARIENGEVTITVDVVVDGRIQETTSHEEWLSVQSELTESLDRRLAQAVRNDMEASLEKAQQELQTDIYGFGNLIYRTMPDEWKNLEEKWDQLYPGVKVELRVEANVRRTGLVKDPIKIR